MKIPSPSRAKGGKLCVGWNHRQRIDAAAFNEMAAVDVAITSYSCLV